MNEEVTGAPSEKFDYDRMELARLGHIALQGRRISDVMEQTKLSRSTISKLLNQSMKGRPSVDTLRKLTGDDRPALLRRMLEACGYPPDTLEAADDFCRKVEETPIRSDAAAVRVIWSASRALAMVLDSLEAKGYGTRFSIDYRADGCFAVDLGGQAYPLLVVIPVIRQEPELSSNRLMRLALEGVSKGIARWGMEHTATLVLTDSPSAFRLLQQLPNLFQVMAVAVVSEDGRGFARQYTIIPTHPSADPAAAFPVDLTISG